MLAAAFLTGCIMFSGACRMLWCVFVPTYGTLFFAEAALEKAHDSWYGTMPSRSRVTNMIVFANHVIFLSCLLLIGLSTAGIELRWGAINTNYAALGVMYSAVLSGIAFWTLIMPGYSLDDAPPYSLFVLIPVAVTILMPFPSDDQWMFYNDESADWVHTFNLWRNIDRYDFSRLTFN